MPHLHDQLDLPRCPHCGVDKPSLHMTKNFNTDRHNGGRQRFWRTYSCRNCGGAILAGANSDRGNVEEMYPRAPIEQFDFENLPTEVADDFREALDCYSISRFNAFAAMARRTVQSISTNLGAKGGDKVLSQLKELKELAQIDDETFDILKQIVVGGHDGAHPHLPKLSPERAGVLLELMKDVLHQLFVRKAKIKAAIELRKKSTEPNAPAAG